MRATHDVRERDDKQVPCSVGEPGGCDIFAYRLDQQRQARILVAAEQARDGRRSLDREWWQFDAVGAESALKVGNPRRDGLHAGI